jgi:hypothetical protein
MNSTTLVPSILLNTEPYSMLLNQSRSVQIPVKTEIPKNAATRTAPVMSSALERPAGRGAEAGRGLAGGGSSKNPLTAVLC